MEDDQSMNTLRTMYSFSEKIKRAVLASLVAGCPFCNFSSSSRQLFTLNIFFFNLRL